MAAAGDVVQQASQLLTTYVHCRKEAAGLQACRRQHGAGSQECARHHSAFVACANASSMQVVSELVKIADKHCPEEIAAFHRCKLQQPLGDCDELDLAALQCASRRVLESARAPAR